MRADEYQINAFVHVLDPFHRTGLLKDLSNLCFRNSCVCLGVRIGLLLVSEEIESMLALSNEINQDTGDKGTVHTAKKRVNSSTPNFPYCQ